MIESFIHGTLKLTHSSHHLVVVWNWWVVSESSIWIVVRSREVHSFFLRHGLSFSRLGSFPCNNWNLVKFFILRLVISKLLSSRWSSINRAHFKQRRLLSLLATWNNSNRYINFYCLRLFFLVPMNGLFTNVILNILSHFEWRWLWFLWDQVRQYPIDSFVNLLNITTQRCYVIFNYFQGVWEM